MNRSVLALLLVLGCGTSVAAPEVATDAGVPRFLPPDASRVQRADGSPPHLANDAALPGHEGGCVPATCASQGVGCGPTDDTCGGVIQCGTCPSGETCGGGGVPSQCGSSCTPKTCESQGLDCGPAGDGCGGSLDCGTCGGSDTCGGGGTPSKCGSQCTPKTCEALGFNCGPAGDGCGGSLDCGNCSGGQTCGGGGSPGVCGDMPCTPKTCAELGYDCGPAGDGCGGSLACGSCSSGDTCGSTSQPGRCVPISKCVPETCASLGFTCGPAGDGCGGSLECGTCPTGQICGGAAPGVCAVPTCTPKTCASAGPETCGPVADGCGGLLQCGACALPKTCGGVTPGQCGVAATCTNLCLEQTTCSGSSSTTITGTVYAPNGTDPLPNVLVYIPNGEVQPLAAGAACERCSDEVTGDPLVSAVTDTTGAFTLSNAPAGTNIPLVIQTGKWRRQVTIPSVAPCVTNALPACTNATATSGACLTSLPQTKAQGDIPLMAFATGSVDALECVLRGIGVADSEFTNPGAGGRINLYLGFRYSLFGEGGAEIDSSTPSEEALVGDAATLAGYDMVLFPCQGNPLAEDENVYDYRSGALLGQWSSIRGAYQSNLLNYANSGGRIFATHYSYYWLYDNAPFSTTAAWNTSDDDPYDSATGYIETGFPKGEELAEWLQNIGASTTLGQIPLRTVNIDLSSIPSPPSQLWMQLDSGAPMHYTFTTPVGGASGSECGEVLYDDFHVEVTQDQEQTFPKECTSTTLTPQQKLVEFMIFDLGSCVGPSTPTCTPTTCEALGYNCGPAGDGCGNVLECGTCSSGEICGGGGNPSVCGAPTCTPRSCPQQGFTCGPAGDGCGNSLDCGTCPSGEACGGSGQPGVCGGTKCSPRSCAAQGITCGPAGDGCGNELECGSCPSGDSCGGGGKAGTCGRGSCTATTCEEQGIQCGPAGDGCGNELECGSCPSGQTCGGGGTPGVCGGTCTPATCASLGIECGPAGDGCGGSLECGTCTGSETCGGGGKPGVCGSICLPKTCSSLGYNCGAAADGCGNLLDCGSCSAPNTCGGGGQANVCGGSVPK